jgi:ketosteroid isomerase-like protein
VRDQIINAYKAWNEACNRGDAGAVAALWTGNAKLLPPTHQVIEGRQAIEAFWDGLLKAGLTGHRIELISGRGRPVGRGRGRPRVSPGQGQRRR